MSINFFTKFTRETGRHLGAHGQLRKTIFIPDSGRAGGIFTLRETLGTLLSLGEHGQLQKTISAIDSGGAGRWRGAKLFYFTAKI